MSEETSPVSRTELRVFRSLRDSRSPNTPDHDNFDDSRRVSTYSEEEKKSLLTYILFIFLLHCQVLCVFSCFAENDPEQKARESSRRRNKIKEEKKSQNALDDVKLLKFRK